MAFAPNLETCVGRWRTLLIPCTKNMIYIHTHISFSFDFLLPVLRTIPESCMKVTDWTLLDMDALQYIHNGRKDWFGLLHDILNRDLCSRFLFWHFKENCGIYYLCFFYMLLVRMIGANIFFFYPVSNTKSAFTSWLL